MVRSLLLALAFVVSASGLAQAQDTSLISVSRRQIQGVEQFSAPSPVTAEMVPFGDEVALVLADVAANDKTDPTKSFWFHLYRSINDGQTWLYAGGFRFVGSADTPTNAVIGTAIPAAQFVGARFRIEIDAPNRMSLGGSVTITRTPPF